MGFTTCFTKGQRLLFFFIVFVLYSGLCVMMGICYSDERPDWCAVQKKDWKTMFVLGFVAIVLFFLCKSLFDEWMFPGYLTLCPPTYECITEEDLDLGTSEPRLSASSDLRQKFQDDMDDEQNGQVSRTSTKDMFVKKMVTTNSRE